MAKDTYVYVCFNTIALIAYVLSLVTCVLMAVMAYSNTDGHETWITWAALVSDSIELIVLIPCVIFACLGFFIGTTKYYYRERLSLLANFFVLMMITVLDLAGAFVRDGQLVWPAAPAWISIIIDVYFVCFTLFRLSFVSSLCGLQMMGGKLEARHD
jgi:hypothetical protein